MSLTTIDPDLRGAGGPAETANLARGSATQVEAKKPERSEPPQKSLWRSVVARLGDVGWFLLAWAILVGAWEAGA